MTLNLVRRSTKGAPLTAIDHDGNLDKIEQAIEAVDPAGFATAAQGAKADSAIQPAALSSALADKVDSADPRLADAREWSAETVSQAEAEAGTATARRAWTALRVAQAIAAWWAGSAARTKLDGIAAGATANATDAQLRDRSTHTGTQAASTITGLAAVATSGAYSDLSGRPTLGTAAPLDVAAAGDASAAQVVKGDDSRLTDSREWTAITINQAEAEAGTATTRRAWTAQRVFQSVAAWWAASSAATKLAGIATGATANQADAFLLARANHTGTQAWGTITGTPTTRGGYGITDAAANGAIGSSGLTMSTSRLLGRSTAGTGAPEEITLGTNLSLSGTTLNATGGNPGGTSGQLQWNNGGAFAGLSTSSIDGSGNMTFSGRWINSTNGAASAPPVSLTGTWFTGGTATTTKPHFLIEPAGTTSTNWSTFGTGFGLNAPSGFPGNLLDLQVNGTSYFRANIGAAGFGNVIVGTATNHLALIGDSQGRGIYANSTTGATPSGIYLWAAGQEIYLITNSVMRASITNTSLALADGINIAAGVNVGTKIGVATTQKLGFYGATPAVQPAAVADATDASTVITQLNALLSRLRTIGLIAT